MISRSPWQTDASYERAAGRFRPLIDRIAQTAPERERRRQPSPEQFGWLRDAGFGVLRIPRDHTGADATLSDVFLLAAELAEVDPNLSHVWRNHFSFIEDRLHARTETGGEELLAHLGVSRSTVGGGFGERNTAPGELPATRLEEDPDGSFRLTGTKYYSTGSIYADWITVLARIDGSDEPVVALVAVDQPGVRVDDDWDGFGQQVTGSGSVHYEGARVEPAHVVAYRQRYDYAPHFYQTYLHAVLVGIGRAVVRDVTQALHARGRSHANNVAAVPREDPQLLQVVGEITALVQAADALFRDSVRSIDCAVSTTGEERATALDASWAAVAAAQVVVTENVLRAATLLFDALGASSTDGGRALDRHWRNARTLASHNPRGARARQLGDFLVNGRRP